MHALVLHTVYVQRAMQFVTHLRFLFHPSQDLPPFSCLSLSLSLSLSHIMFLGSFLFLTPSPASQRSFFFEVKWVRMNWWLEWLGRISHQGASVKKGNVCVRQREGEREREKERERVCVCVREREREEMVKMSFPKNKNLSFWTPFPLSLPPSLLPVSRRRRSEGISLTTSRFLTVFKELQKDKETGRPHQHSL